MAIDSESQEKLKIFNFCLLFIFQYGVVHEMPLRKIKQKSS
ncbi:hypothetical protein H1P_220027 [Hyella patelloides LEGE 07179]|uniref:Uncharacterized protein n=1 Tax=Hyella patelloides LEGE 07179 TaxID=945734 RepID=A0A563VQP6_9CYAN|nr:hypothetical protein H1P_220027 [Hyella patelloides LEGE 07179]